MRPLCAALLFTATLASAQAAPAADIEQLWPDPAGRGALFVGNGRTLERGGFRVGLTAFYTRSNLRRVDGSSLTDLVQDRVGFQLFGAVGVLDWLELGANVPVLVSQQGAASLALAPAGLGNPWLHARVALLDAGRPVSLAMTIGVGVPAGTAAAQGNGGLEWSPRVQLGRVYDRVQLGAELGLLHRPEVDFGAGTGGATDRVGSQVFLSAMVATVNETGPRGEFSVRTFVPLSGSSVPGLEGQLGFRLPVGPVELILSAGPGFGGWSTTPVLRGYAGVAFANVPMTEPTCVEGRRYALADCPDLDRDGDGVKNSDDGAPDAAEDKDGFQDTDGAPDPDNDGDGVPDLEDACDEQVGPAENGGCPDADADRDGVVDRLDRCRDLAEDRDDFQDADGCPEVDNDGDGFLDGADACPLQAGIAQERGCPAKDADGDQVSDHEDNCPAEAGAKENAGCPAAKKQLVVITAEKLKLLDAVLFDTGLARIQKRSFGLLDHVAQVLVAHPELALVQVEVHTEGGGAPGKDKRLSQERADAVKAYLLKRGLAEGRVRAVGFVAEKPVESNEAPAGRDANCRAEFNLVR